MSIRLAGFRVAMLAILALSCLPAAASDIPDLRGEWTATYLAVSPTRDDRPGPRFNQGEMVLEIQEQRANAFWGINKWRVIGRESWNEAEVAGSLSLHDPSKVSITEMSTDPEIGVVGTLDGTLVDEKLYLNFRGLRTGTSYSTVLERSSDKE